MPVVYDVALPDSATINTAASITTGFGSLPGSLSLGPDGAFAVYPARRGESSVLWWRSLRDEEAHAIPGTEGGAIPRVSPDGTRLAFVQGNRTMVLPIAGGTPRTLLESDPPQTLEWVSGRRLMVVNRDGFNLVWLDPETGIVSQQGIGSFFRRCVFARLVGDSGELLCWFNEGISAYDPKTNDAVSLRQRNADGSPGAALAGTSFRVVDGRYLMYVSPDGDVRAAPYDAKAHLVGRSVTIVRGVRLDNLGATLMDLAPGGLLMWATGAEARLTELVRRGPDGSVTPLVSDTAKFLRFDVSRDRRFLAAVVTTGETQELRIYDLASGRRTTWLRADNIRHPLWSPDGTRILTRVQNGTESAIVLGAPDAATAPDTLLRAVEPARAPDVMEYHDTHLVLLRDFDRTIALVADPTARPFRMDSLLADITFPTLSPDGRRFAWHTSSRGELFVSGWPLGGPRVQVATGGVEPVWVSNTELVYRSGVQWSIARFDPRTGALVGKPEPWGRDPRFADTPGWSNRTDRAGGLIYSRVPTRPDPAFLRVMPRFLDSLRTAVEAANR